MKNIITKISLIALFGISTQACLADKSTELSGSNNLSVATYATTKEEKQVDVVDCSEQNSELNDLSKQYKDVVNQLNTCTNKLDAQDKSGKNDKACPIVAAPVCPVAEAVYIASQFSKVQKDKDVVETIPAVLQGDLEVSVELPSGGGDTWTHQVITLDSEPLTVPARIAMFGRKADLSAYTVSIEITGADDSKDVCSYKPNRAGSLVLSSCVSGVKADESVQAKDVKLVVSRTAGSRPFATFKAIFNWE